MASFHSCVKKMHRLSHSLHYRWKWIDITLLSVQGLSYCQGDSSTVSNLLERLLPNSTTQQRELIVPFCITLMIQSHCLSERTNWGFFFKPFIDIKHLENVSEVTGANCDVSAGERSNKRTKTEAHWGHIFAGTPDFIGLWNRTLFFLSGGIFLLPFSQIGYLPFGFKRADWSGLLHTCRLEPVNFEENILLSLQCIDTHLFKSYSVKPSTYSVSLF